MDDLIKSMEKSLLAFDKESIERELTSREKKEKENLNYEIYWIKFKKFKADFERLIFTDVQELANSLKTILLEKNIVLRIETHIKNSTRFFGPDLSFYTIISISDKSLSLNNRWERCPFLLIIGKDEKDTIELHDCNQDLEYVYDYIEKNIWGDPIEQFKLKKYNFSLLKPHIDTWLDKNVDRIHNSESYKKKYKIV